MATLNTAIALLTLANLKEYLDLSGSGEDSVLTAFINECSQAVIDYLGRPLISKTYTEYYDGPSGSELLLDKYPISSITTLNDDVDRAFASGDDIASGDILLDGAGGSLRLWNNESGFVQGKANVKVVYVAGYTQANVPDSIKLAVKRWIGSHYMKHKERRHDVASESVGDTTTTFDRNEMPADVKKLLGKFKARGIMVGRFIDG